MIYFEKEAKLLLPLPLISLIWAVFLACIAAKLCLYLFGQEDKNGEDK